MVQNAEAEAFLRRLAELPETPGVDLSPAITPSLQDEAELRRLFATDRINRRLKDPYVGLVDVFGEHTARIRKIHARAIHHEEDLNKRYVMPLDDDKRKKDGEDSMALSIDDFKARWEIFSEGALSQVANWDNIVVAGGSVLACLAPLPEHVINQSSKRALRKYYHSEAFPASDVDLFLYGLAPEQAEAKCLEIFKAVQDAVPWETCAVRTKHAVSIHCQYPYRPVQIVLRMYQSPAEILAGFDIDSACVAFDGTRVLAAPRAIVALMTQSNRVSMDRRSPSYEVRLAKYASRGFEIHVPDLRREDLDPTIFERALHHLSGLARLLVLEKLASQESRDGYRNQRRRMHGRPTTTAQWVKRCDRRRLKGDLKVSTEFSDIQMSDYDVMFHVPYGPGITAKRISKMIYRTDLAMNSTFKNKNKARKFHRHPAFFGNMKEALNDCCEHCPRPRTAEEREMFEKEQERFITGRVSFIQHDPGRQSITGSFHPIDSGEWSEQAYLKPLTKLFTYISLHSRAQVNDFLKRNAEAINTRDHLGRTPLQFALLCSAEEICWDLIEAGGRMTVKMVDGRSSLHLASQMGLESVVRRLLERSGRDAKEKQARETKEKSIDGGVEKRNREYDETQNSSENDWSSEHDTDEDYKEARKNVGAKPNPQGEGDALDEPEDQPDILDINIPDWDQCLTPLGYAIIGGHLSVVKTLVAAGADCKTPRKLSEDYHRVGAATFFPLSLTALTPCEVVGAQIAEHLITAGGASCSAADSDALTIFHRLVSLNKPMIIETILRVDPTAKVASRFLYPKFQNKLHPIVTAFANDQRAMVAVLLTYAETRPFIDLEAYDRSIAANPNSNQSYGRSGEEGWKAETIQALEASLIDYNDLWQLVLALEPEVTKNSVPCGVYQCQSQSSLRRSMLDFLRSAVRELQRRLKALGPEHNLPAGLIPETGYQSILEITDAEISGKKGWETFVVTLEKRNQVSADEEAQKMRERKRNERKGLTVPQIRQQAVRFLVYFQHVLAEFEKLGAKTWDEIYPQLPSAWAQQYKAQDFDPDSPDAPKRTSTSNRVAWNSRGHAWNGTMGQAGSLVDGRRENTTKPYKRYTVFTSIGLDNAGAHLIPLYDELYEACWNGENSKIRSLCLPSQDDTGSSPSEPRDLLQITAAAAYTGHLSRGPTGYTPFFVAILARKWDTARLVLEIAQQQYIKGGENENATESISGNRITLSYHDDDQVSCASDDTEKRPLGFSDLAGRFHNVSVKVKPNQLLSHPTRSTYEATSRRKAFGASTDPISHAIRMGDLEAFNQIADMMTNLEEPMSLPEELRDIIIENDAPDLLDAYIRRTGDGLLLPRGRIAESPDGKPQIQHQDDKDGVGAHGVYQGLNVNGKKRKDLAQREDPNVPFESLLESTEAIPIGWRAASKGSTAIVEYLCTKKAFDAYKFYSKRSGEKLAKRIAEALQDPSDFLAMVGLSITRLSETPVLAAVWTPPTWEVSDRYPLYPNCVLPTLKKLMELQPKLTVDGLRSQVKPNRLSAFLVLCTVKLPLEVFDWMLANGADPMIRDERGWNIFHLMFQAAPEADLRASHPSNPSTWMMANRTKIDTNWDLIEHALTRLPAETVATLMVQQSRTYRNTPLSIAVKLGNFKLVDLLLRIAKDAVTPSFFLRDNTGATLLHTAILKGYSKIVSLLVGAGAPDVLYMENGVGSTPMEMARSQYLSLTLRNSVLPLAFVGGFDVRGVDRLRLDRTPGMRDRDEQDIKALRAVLHRMKNSDVSVTKPGLFEVLSAFADRSEEDCAAWVAQKPEVDANPDTDPNPVDVTDVVATFNALSKVVVEVHQRQLVHHHDVQSAVISAIEIQNAYKPEIRTRHGGGLAAEQIDPQNDPDYSVILGHPNVDFEPCITCAQGPF